MEWLDNFKLTSEDDGIMKKRNKTTETRLKETASIGKNII